MTHLTDVAAAKSRQRSDIPKEGIGVLNVPPWPRPPHVPCLVTPKG
jgi:hypothetical protein